VTLCRFGSACKAESDAWEAKLWVLVAQAWELRRSRYLRDACDAIVDAHARRPLARLELAQERQAQARRAPRLAHAHAEWEHDFDHY
jgi:hypothetical protein